MPIGPKSDGIFTNGSQHPCPNRSISTNGMQERIKRLGSLRPLYALWLLVLLVDFGRSPAQNAWAQSPQTRFETPAERQISSRPVVSAGQVASVFESDPEWLEWIASKNRKSNAKSSWSSWWPSGSNTKSSRPARSYGTNNKTMAQRFSLSSKRMWNKTAAWLDPYPDPKPQSESKKSSWFSSWTNAWGSEPKKPSQSVSDFIGQEHPR
jgi:hypothetical protein